MKNMRRLGYVAGLLGLATVIALVIHQGWSTIFSAIGHAGWRLLWLLPFHVLPLLLDVIGWRVLLARRDPHRQATIPVLFWIAAIREACNRLLPVANVGGEIIGIRLIRWRGIDSAVAAASVIVEVLLSLVNLYLFAVLGMVLLIELTHSISVPRSILLTLIASLLVPVVLIVLLRHGKVFSRLEIFAEKLLGGRSRLSKLIDGSRLDMEIRILYGRPGRLLVACIWQFLGLLVGSFESWLALRLLGYPVSVWDAIAIEAVTQALRQLNFVTPAGLGTQEVGLVLFGNMIGLPPDASIALSLVKRMREITFGVPALISWQWAETHKLRTEWRSSTSPDLSNTRNV